METLDVERTELRIECRIEQAGLLAIDPRRGKEVDGSQRLQQGAQRVRRIRNHIEPTRLAGSATACGHLTGDSLGVFSARRVRDDDAPASHRHEFGRQLTEPAGTAHHERDGTRELVASHMSGEVRRGGLRLRRGALEGLHAAVHRTLERDIEQPHSHVEPSNCEDEVVALDRYHGQRKIERGKDGMQSGADHADEVRQRSRCGDCPGTESRACRGKRHGRGIDRNRERVAATHVGLGRHVDRRGKRVHRGHFRLRRRAGRRRCVAALGQAQADPRAHERVDRSFERYRPGIPLHLREHDPVTHADRIREGATDGGDASIGRSPPVLERGEENVNPVDDLPAREQPPCAHGIHVHGVAVGGQHREPLLIFVKELLLAESGHACLLCTVREIMGP